MKLSELDRKIIRACCRYFEQKEGISKRIAHAVKMVQKDLESHYEGAWIPRKARLKQIVHIVHETCLDLSYLKPQIHYDVDQMLLDRPTWSKSKKNGLVDYYARVVERYGHIPSIVKEHGEELNQRLYAWYQRNEKVDGQSRVVVELGLERLALTDKIDHSNVVDMKAIDN